MKPITQEWVDKAEGDFAILDNAFSDCIQIRQIIRQHLNIS
jgi:hypothetical protein